MSLLYRGALLALAAEVWLLATLAAVMMHAAADHHRFRHWDCAGAVPGLDELLYELGPGANVTLFLCIGLACLAMPAVLRALRAGLPARPTRLGRPALMTARSVGGLLVVSVAFLLVLLSRETAEGCIALAEFLQPRRGDMGYELWDAAWLRAGAGALPLVGLAFLACARRTERVLALMTIALGVAAAFAPEVAARFMDWTWLCSSRPASFREALSAIGLSLPPAFLAVGVALEVRAWRRERAAPPP